MALLINNSKTKNAMCHQIKNINVNITDFVLTPLSCACLINQIIKCLVYQKSQIPYPYNWLESVINRKRKSNESDKKINFTAQKHYQVVSCAYDTLEDIMKNIQVEFNKPNNIVQEILIMFGTTPFSPKEIFTLKIPKIAMGHIEANHINITIKNQHKILRNIFLSEEWLMAMESTIPSTNMYIMLKKISTNTSNDFFHFNRNFIVPSTVKNTIISLNYQESDLCCENLKIFEDKLIENTKTVHLCNDVDAVEEDGNWFQAKSLVKGFKDCFVNKMSASELW